MFAGGFIQKTIKEDLLIKGNHGILCKQRGKTLEHFRRQPTEVEPKRLTYWTGQPHPQAA
jgi:hypothetical protein